VLNKYRDFPGPAKKKVAFFSEWVFAAVLQQPPTSSGESMCGIVGYIGTRRVVPVLLEGLKRLEYRGYDSAGLVFHHENKLTTYRCEGKLANLENLVDEVIGTPAHVGLGHTRWATHGAPTEKNAHPHTDQSGRVVVVHNGIIENYNSLRENLKKEGFIFSSDTDTEVLAHLIARHLEDDLADAVRRALALVEGTYALGVMSADHPGMLIGARNNSPLVMGVVDDGSLLLASDIPALLPFTTKVILLDDQQMAVLSAQGPAVFSLKTGAAAPVTVQTIDWSVAMAEKGGHKHFMLKEIYEQPQVITNTISGRVDAETGVVDLPEIALDEAAIQKLERIYLVACGTSWHAALVAKQWIEKYARIPVEVDYASEFRYRTILVTERVLVVAISQSGETADTLAGMRRARELGGRAITICNVVGSTMTREADGTLYTHAGPEIGVAATKTFMAQLVVLYLFALYLGQRRRLVDDQTSKRCVRNLVASAAVVERVLSFLPARIKTLIESYHDCRDFLFVGRGLTFPIALEGALKLKELSYIHAEGYAAGELKHGPLALIDRDMPVVALAPGDAVYHKTISNVQEIKARQGRLILIGDEGDDFLADLGDHVVVLPTIDEDLSPILYSLPAQLLAYEIANRRGCDVDQPRNLAKSVTVE
jgi:glucosamine--fructose-6-phosphate aminotransferase (isomerizing)